MNKYELNDWGDFYFKANNAAERRSKIKVLNRRGIGKARNSHFLRITSYVFSASF